jgi:chemotaxis protein methyltransferase CheR
MKQILNRNLTERQFTFTEKDFERIRKLIYDHAGISLNPAKKDMVYSRLVRRIRELGLDSFQIYLGLLEKGDETEWELFVNSLTTNLTSFFREEHHFPILSEHINERRTRTPINIWCSASSTGEEPYSIAMTMVELFGSYQPPVKIYASDVDTNVLAKAREGIYTTDRLEKMPDHRIRRFFKKGTGENQGKVRIRQELRGMIEFLHVNLLDESWPLNGKFDAIFCRNVMIYFDKPTQYSILKKFVPLLKEDGLMFAGHSESFLHAADLFKLRRKTVYELSDQQRKVYHK